MHIAVSQACPICEVFQAISILMSKCLAAELNFNKNKTTADQTQMRHILIIEGGKKQKEQRKGPQPHKLSVPVSDPSSTVWFSGRMLNDEMVPLNDFIFTGLVERTVLASGSCSLGSKLL